MNLERVQSKFVISIYYKRVHAAACEFIIFMIFLFCFVLFWFWVWFLEVGGPLTIDLQKLHSINSFTRNKKLDELLELKTVN
jgi:hypothetical protein